MTNANKTNRNTIPLQIPTSWTPEQAFAVFELIDELRDAIWRCYALQLQEEYRDDFQHRAAKHDPIDPDDLPF
jgi:hypothetical protein